MIQVLLFPEVFYLESEQGFDLEHRVDGLAYDWAGDLVLTFSSPDGTTIELANRTGKTSTNAGDLGSSSDFNGLHVF